MPWPFVPPEPDLPSPADRDPAGRLTATRITLDGMEPHLDQARLRFVTMGGKAAVWVPHHDGGYRYSGVLFAQLEAADALAMEWLDDGGRRTKHKLSARDVPEWPAAVTGVWARRQVDKVSLTVKCVAPASGKYQLVVAPYCVEWPRLESAAAYAEAGVWPQVSGASKLAFEVPALPGVDTYAVFVARGMPSRAQPVSPVTLVTLHD
ncbi:MAG: hypothetical protein KC613_10190 [Myxococcales bacterium]|nr:hypothetical protein [Myxococcales bacterium]MCB9525177.1 hypothetical protein [Myxococcales bacterium]